jgi:hypothetical protein
LLNLFFYLLLFLLFLFLLLLLLLSASKIIIVICLLFNFLALPLRYGPYRNYALSVLLFLRAHLSLLQY